MSEPRIQLWTDDTNSEFAIFLNSTYVIRTNPNVEFTKKIDESVCMQGYEYDWKHTLTQWVNFLFGNQFQLSPEKLHISYSPQGSVDNTQSRRGTIGKIKIPRPHNFSKNSKIKLNRSSRQMLKPNLIKCNFCNLKYYIDEERIEHEKLWHAEKIA